MIKSDPKRKIFEKLDIIKTCEAIEIKLNAAIVQFFFQCTRMTMNNISTSGGQTSIDFGIENYV